MKLLVRSTTGSEPTPEGLAVVEWSRRILREAHRFDGALLALRAGNTGRLRIAASYTIAEFVLPGWLSRFRQRHARDEVSLAVMNSDAVVQQLLAGLSDVGFVETPKRPPGFDDEIVGTDHLVAVVPPSHPWARRTSISAQDLVSEPLVVREQGSGTRASLEQALGARGVGSPHIALELGSTAAVRSAVITGGTPAVISRLAVEFELNVGSLIAIEVPDLDLRRDLRAIWPKTAPLSELARDLIDIITAGESLSERCS